MKFSLSSFDFFQNFFFVFSRTNRRRRRRRTREEKKSRTKKVPFVLQDSTTNLSNNYVPTRSSTTVVDAIIGSTPREAFRRPMQQQTTTPASAGVDFDDAKKTPRRLGLVFGVGYYRSGERHGERFEIDRGAQFPPIIIIFFFVVVVQRITIRFHLFAFFDDRSIERERRAEDHLLLQFYQKTTPPTHARARALSSEGEKRGRRRRRRRRRKQRFGGRDSIRFEFFFSFDDGGRGDVSLPIEFVSFFPPRENASSAFLFFSFLSRKGGGGRSIFYYFYFGLFYNVFAVTHQSRIYVCSFCSARKRKCKCK